MIWGFLLGVYTVGAVMTFGFTGFFVILGGRNGDLWKPFCYAALWFVSVPLLLAGRLK